jgi:hypothetical protein
MRLLGGVVAGKARVRPLGVFEGLVGDSLCVEAMGGVLILDGRV